MLRTVSATFSYYRDSVRGPRADRLTALQALLFIRVLFSSLQIQQFNQSININNITSNSSIQYHKCC